MNEHLCKIDHQIALKDEEVDILRRGVSEINCVRVIKLWFDVFNIGNDNQIVIKYPPYV